jgi:predicted DNA-binding transcriptional regulator AlpA
MDTPEPAPKRTAARARTRAPQDGRAAAVMTTEEAADYLGINKKTLDRMRGRGDGPRFIRITSKIIKYRQADIDDFLTARVRLNTAEP